MRQSTIADYNSKDRALEFCIDIYFNGESHEPLHCTRANYLIDCDVLDEACSDTDTFIGVPSANEVSFQLFGSSGLFNPLNEGGIYYGKITTGIMLKVYCRPIDTTEECIWDQLGEYYVSDWQTDLTGITANVTALDKLSSVINNGKTKVPVIANQSYEELIKSFMYANAITPIIVGNLSEPLTYGFISDTNSAFLSAFSIGALAFIFFNHAGSLQVLDIDRQQSIAFTITDNDQIISVKSTQSILNKYSGVSLQYVKAQLSNETELLNNKRQLKVTQYTDVYSNQIFSKEPVYGVTRASIKSDNDIMLTGYTASSSDITYELVGQSQLFDISIFGSFVEFIDIELADNSDNNLYVKTKYVQNENYATHLKALLNKFISMPVPILELDVRCNPLIPIGAKLHVISQMYNVDFTGILIRQTFKYDGGLSGTMTILSSEIVGD